jgi:hypothetical protein
MLAACCCWRCPWEQTLGSPHVRRRPLAKLGCLISAAREEVSSRRENRADQKIVECEG